MFVQQQLEEWDADGLVWATITVVSELATNAVLHARTEFSMVIELVADGVNVRVADSSSTKPVRRRYDPDAATGRGMALIEALTTEWGVLETDTGKVVWCTVAPAAVGLRVTDDPTTGSDTTDTAAGHVSTDVSTAGDGTASDSTAGDSTASDGTATRRLARAGTSRLSRELAHAGTSRCAADRDASPFLAA